MHDVRKAVIWRKYWLLFLGYAACLMLAGCSAETEDENDVVMLEHQEESEGYLTVKATVEDVVRTARLRCIYVQTETEELSVDESGKWVENVFVGPGDDVAKGDLLAVLTGGNQEAEIKELEYKIARNKLLLGYTELDEAYDRSYRWWTYIYQTAMSDKDKEELEDSLESIGQKYRYLREDYQDAIELDTLKAEVLRESMNESRLYAGMDGTITYMFNTNLPLYTWVEKGEVLIRIADNSTCIFETTQTTYADCFSEGQVLELTLDAGSSQRVVDVVPYDMGNWGEKLFFEMIDGDNTELPAGVGGSLLVTVGRREQVLAIPKELLHTAGVKYYVYVEGADQLREVRWIEIGLAGDDLVEIVSGLSEGEEIIMR